MAKLSLRRPFREPTIDFLLRLPPDLARWIDDEARARRVTKTKLVVDCLRTQQTLQQQLAESLTLGPRDTQGTGTHILQVLLAQLREEIAQSIDAQTVEVKKLRGQLQCTQTMLDRSYYGFLLHTDPVPEDKRPQRKAEAQRRYERWTEEIRTLTQRGAHGTATDPAPTAPAPRPR